MLHSSVDHRGAGWRVGVNVAMLRIVFSAEEEWADDLKCNSREILSVLKFRVSTRQADL